MLAKFGWKPFLKLSNVHSIEHQCLDLALHKTSSVLLYKLWNFKFFTSALKFRTIGNFSLHWLMMHLSLNGCSYIKKSENAKDFFYTMNVYFGSRSQSFSKVISFHFNILIHFVPHTIRKLIEFIVYTLLNN